MKSAIGAYGGHEWTYCLANLVEFRETISAACGLREGTT